MVNTILGCPNPPEPVGLGLASKIWDSGMALVPAGVTFLFLFSILNTGPQASWMQEKPGICQEQGGRFFPSVRTGARVGALPVPGKTRGGSSLSAVPYSLLWAFLLCRLPPWLQFSR